MLRAFEETGYEVWAITGTARERARAARRVWRHLRSGGTFAFAYGETHSLPAALTEPHHVPTHPLLEARIFSALARHRVPSGVFYRDVFWRFRALSHEGVVERQVARAFHTWDWQVFRRHVDHLFLPSLGVAEHLPGRWPRSLSALPPGATGDAPPRTAAREARPLELLYVGGVKPPVYDLRPTFAFAAATRGVRVTLCCRQEEWAGIAHAYEVPANVRIVHASGGELDRLYDEADAVVIAWEATTYLSFAMPVKVAEAITHGVPIITTPGTETARFVEREGLGWVVDDAAGFGSLVAMLTAKREVLDAAYRAVWEARARHAWTARAREVAATLTRTTGADDAPN